MLCKPLRKARELGRKRKRFIAHQRGMSETKTLVLPSEADVTAAIKIIDKPEHWARGVFFQTAPDAERPSATANSVLWADRPDTPEYCRVCAMGALAICAGQMAANNLAPIGWSQSIMAANDVGGRNAAIAALSALRDWIKEKRRDQRA